MATLAPHLLFKATHLGLTLSHVMCALPYRRLDVGDGMHGLRNIFTHIIDYLLEDPTLARAMAGANLRDASIQDTANGILQAQL